MILDELPSLPALPAEFEAELAAFEHLSDDVLWLLVNNILSTMQQDELARLNEAGQQRELSLAEQERQQTLLNTYERMIVRRAHAAAILKGRGHDLSIYKVNLLVIVP